MKNRVLVFIPYQDSDNFMSDGILTREFAMLYLLWKKGFETVINLKKPRTILDKKHYNINNMYYPNGTIENKVKTILENSKTIQYLPLISLNQIIKKRAWWEKGYLGIKKRLFNELSDDKDYLVYSNNPFAVELLEQLKKYGCKIYFDIMDNFAIHPSLCQSEREAALRGYNKILTFADCISANSQQTCDFMAKYSSKKIFLVKNGVFLNNETNQIKDCPQIKQLLSKKTRFSKTVGYVGKLGKRLDENIIKEISDKCKETLFVFVGPYLTGQINDNLIYLFKNSSNVLHLDGIPSAYVYSMLDQFDILMIPHSVGKNENGGDPLKLYQYMTRSKPIITTPILGVEEFKDYIKITSDVQQWIEFIENDCYEDKIIDSNEFAWETRIKPIISEINL